MFLGGTIVLSIAASFFGATGIMGLKYIQEDCYDEVREFFAHGQAGYLEGETNFAEETLVILQKSNIYLKNNELTQEYFYETYGDAMIGQPTISSYEIFPSADTEDTLFVYSIIHNTTYQRQQVLNKKLYTGTNILDEEGRLKDIEITETQASCFNTVGNFEKINGLLTCAIRFTERQDKFAKYEESALAIVGKESCAHKEPICNKHSTSFPLCCEQFEDEFTNFADCHCINAYDDASCDFDSKCNSYDDDTLDFSKADQKNKYCKGKELTDDWCKVDSNDVNIWDKECSTEANDDATYTCCNDNVFDVDKDIRVWYDLGVEKKITMTPTVCVKYANCLNSKDFINGCCATNTHADCNYCTDTEVTNINQVPHARKCGYNDCFDSSIQDQITCCAEVQKTYGTIFKAGSKCFIALNYKACDDMTNSLACPTITSACNKDTDCFPTCCKNKKFDFTTKSTIEASVASDCFQLASEYIIAEHDTDYLFGHYIYHETGTKTRPKCQVKGIIDPKCCNEDYQYANDDPCFCYGSDDNNDQDYYCNTVHHSECYPGSNTRDEDNNYLNEPYPQCCYDIGSFFGDDHFCSCRQTKNLSGETTTCDKVDISSDKFDFIETCPNPCKNGKALLSDGRYICEIPIFEL